MSGAWLNAASLHRGPSRRPTPVSSSATSTGRRRLGVWLDWSVEDMKQRFEKYEFDVLLLEGSFVSDPNVRRAAIEMVMTV